MGVFMQNGDIVNTVPGGIPTNALERIEADIEELRNLRATLEHYGMGMISESSAVTDTDSGLVLSAKEKNPAIDGTLANLIEKNKEKISMRPEIIVNKEYIPASTENKIFALEDSGVYLVSCGSPYAVGSIYFFQSGASYSGNSRLTKINQVGEYCTVSVEAYNSIKITPGGTSINATIIKIG